MAKYRVIPIAMTVKNNKIAYAGDIVDDSQLNSSAFELIRDGFLELHEESEVNNIAVVEEKVEATTKEDSDAVETSKETADSSAKVSPETPAKEDVKKEQSAAEKAAALKK